MIRPLSGSLSFQLCSPEKPRRIVGRHARRRSRSPIAVLSRPRPLSRSCWSPSLSCIVSPRRAPESASRDRYKGRWRGSVFLTLGSRSSSRAERTHPRPSRRRGRASQGGAVKRQQDHPLSRRSPRRPSRSRHGFRVEMNARRARLLGALPGAGPRPAPGPTPGWDPQGQGRVQPFPSPRRAAEARPPPTARAQSRSVRRRMNPGTSAARGRSKAAAMSRNPSRLRPSGE